MVERTEGPQFETLRLRQLLLDRIGHQLLLGALGANDVLHVRDEALADEGGLAGGAAEAVVVPMPALEGYEPGTADSWKASRPGIRKNDTHKRRKCKKRNHLKQVRVNLSKNANHAFQLIHAFKLFSLLIPKHRFYIGNRWRS